MEMSKAYDGHALVAALEKEGVQGGLDTVKKCVSILADFLRSSAQMSTDGLIGKLDDFAIPGINYFEKLGNEKLDALIAEFAAPAPAPVAAPAPSEPAPEAAPTSEPAPASDPAPQGGEAPSA